MISRQFSRLVTLAVDFRLCVKENMDILISVITSSTILGIVLFIFKESFKAKLAQIAKDLDLLKSYQIKDFDNSSEAIKKIWASLARIDDYAKQGITQDIEAGKLNNLSLRPYHLEIQEAMVFLPEDIYQSTQECLNSMSEAWKKNHSNIVGIVKANKGDKTKEENCVGEVNSCLEILRAEFEVSLKKLRKDYRSYFVKHTNST